MFLVCGEALFDFFLVEEDHDGAATYAARAGGSPFNVAIGLARLGCASGMMTGLSDDLLGQRLRRVLDAEGVSTRYALATRRPTTLSLVGLDTAGVPAYQFYDAGSAGSGVTAADLPPLGTEVTGLHIGSYSLVVPPVADALTALIAARQGRFVSIDPNIRPTVEPDMTVWRRRLEALWSSADLVKISTEDLGLIYPRRAPADFARDLVARGVGLVVVTDGGGPAEGWSAGGMHETAQPPSVEVVDTVGAGDTFQAALLAGLMSATGDPKAGLAGLDSRGLETMLAYAARAAAITCSRRGADLPRIADLA
jgi:fructokinase